MHEPRRRRGAQPRLDRLPGLQVVRQRERAEVVPERRPAARRDRQHRRHPRHHRDLEPPPGLRPRLDRLADRRRHREDPGIAARHQRHPPPAGRERQRRPRPAELLAVVGGMRRLRRPERQPREIGPVAEDVRRRRHRRRAPRPSAAPARPARGRPRRAARSRPRLPARHQHQREVGRAVVRLLGQRHASASRAIVAALDVDRPPELARRRERPPDRRQVAPDLHDHARRAVAEPPRQLAPRAACPAAPSARRRPAPAAARPGSSRPTSR